MSKIEEKIVTEKKLKKLLKRLKELKKVIVTTNGTFDILHAGHITILQQARQMGDVLIVGINSDESVKRYKGNKRPINPLEDRMLALAALESVSLVISFSQDSPNRLLELIKPDIHVKGGDYTLDTLPEAGIIQKNGGKVVIIPFQKRRSTTDIINRIARLYTPKTYPSPSSFRTPYPAIYHQVRFKKGKEER